MRGRARVRALGWGIVLGLVLLVGFGMAVLAVVGFGMTLVFEASR